jgi:hypothetical protein
LDAISELVRALPPEAQARARWAATQIEFVFQKTRAEHPKDPGVALGVAFVIFTIAARLQEIEDNSESKGEGLIKLLN